MGSSFDAVSSLSVDRRTGLAFIAVPHDNIDAEHKDIFEAIFACTKNLSSADLITKLYTVT